MSHHTAAAGIEDTKRVPAKSSTGISADFRENIPTELPTRTAGRHSTITRAAPIAEAPSAKFLKEDHPLLTNHLAIEEQSNTATMNTTGAATRPCCQESFVPAEVADKSAASKKAASGMNMTMIAMTLAARLMMV